MYIVVKSHLKLYPPIFGQFTFAQVISQAGRSLKDNFTFLEDGLRKIADLHTHKVISVQEHLPTNRSIEVYKSQFEILIQEIISRL